MIEMGALDDNTRFETPSSSVAQLDAPAGARDPGPQLGVDVLGVRTGRRRLQHYLLLGELGHGGMGVVYAGYDERLDRKVAIKLLRGRAASSAQQRLIREALALARLSHPNVVRIYEIGQLDERTFLVMEYVEGRTLGAWLSAQPRARREILAVFAAAGRGLAAAHAKGIVHRDFKPDNVMIADDGRVLVMDFGLARANAAEGEARVGQTQEGERPAGALSSELTAAGSIMGTPAYMSPEQIRGAPTDARTDQFSFCVALWEALFRRRPFTAANFDELSDALNAGQVDAPERGEAPGWLRRVLRRGLDPEPARRWPSMEALLDALERDPTRRRVALLGLAAAALVLIGGYTLARARHDPFVWTHEQVRQDLSACLLSAREIETGWNAATQRELAGAFAATELGFADSAWQRTEAWMERYASEWAQLHAETCFAARSAAGARAAELDEISACLEQRRARFIALARAWAEADARTVTLALTAAASLPPVSRCEDPLWRAQRSDPPQQLRARVAELRARLEQVAAQRLAGKFEAGLALARATRDEARALGWRPLEAEAELALGRLEDELGDYEAARASVNRAYLAAVAGNHDRVALEAASWATRVVGDKLRRFEQGRRWGELALSFVERLDLGGTLLEAQVLHGLGLIHDHGGDLDAAEGSLARALEISIAELGPEHPLVGHELTGLGGVYWEQGDLEAALDTQVRALAIRELTLGPEHPEVARSLTNIGLVLARLGRPDSALEAQRRALAIRTAALGPSHPDVAVTFDAIGTTLALRGEHAEALAAKRRALSIHTAELGPEHPKLTDTLHGIAEVLVALGQREQALATARRALAIHEAALGPDHARVLESRARLEQLELGESLGE